MTKDVAEQVQAVLTAIEAQIAALCRIGFDDTAKILAIAKLDLQTKFHDISHDELRAFSNAIAAGRKIDGSPTVISLASRSRRKI